MMLKLLEWEGSKPNLKYIGVPIETLFEKTLVLYGRKKIEHTLATGKKTTIYSPNIQSGDGFRVITFSKCDKNSLFIHAKTINDVPQPLNKSYLCGHISILLDNQYIIQYVGTAGIKLQEPIKAFLGVHFALACDSPTVHKDYPTRALNTIFKSTEKCFETHQELIEIVDTKKHKRSRLCSFSPIDGRLILVTIYFSKLGLNSVRMKK